MKRKILAYLLAFVMTFGMLAGMPGVSFAASSDPVVPDPPESGNDVIFSQQNSGAAPTGKDITADFTDQNFRAVVYERIGKAAPEPILDTDVAEVYDLYAYDRGIKNLDGLEYFISLGIFGVYNNQLTELPALPASLRWFEVGYNQLKELPELPPNLESLYCYGNQLTSLPGLPASLNGLYAWDNQLTELPALPASLRWLEAGSNQLTELPELPSSLESLNCYVNQLASLPGLPANLNGLYVGSNQLTSLPALPENLAELSAESNQLTEIPALPTSLRWLNVGYNQLTELPKLPSSLETLYCWGNGLTGILDVSNLHSLKTLACSGNLLTGLTLSTIAPYTYIGVQNNFLPDESAVTGRVIAWDGSDFIFLPQYSGVAPTGKDITAEFTDLNFRAAVYENIGKAAPAPILDTDVAWVQELWARGRGIKNLDGLEYFIGLGTLGVYNNQLTEVPALPASLRWLEVSYNQLTELPELPSSLESLYCYDNQLTSLPGLPANLGWLGAGSNQLTSLPALPENLVGLEVGGNQLTSLPSLPAKLSWLHVWANQLTSLPSLPASLGWLGAGSNQLTSLPALPENLVELEVGGNQLTSLPSLPANLSWLHVWANQLTSLPSLPANLGWLNVGANQLAELPKLPSSLETLYCYDNQLKELPELPGSLRWLDACYNQLTELPELPSSLEVLYCYENQLTLLPSLPPSLTHLLASSNQLTSLPVLPENLVELDIGGNHLATLPKMPLNLTMLSCWGNGITGILDVSYLHSLEWLICSGNRLTGLALSASAPYSYIYAAHNYMVSMSAITGRTINWDIDPDFIFSPQNPRNLIFISKKPTEQRTLADNTTFWYTTNVLRNGELIEGGLNLASDYDVGLYGMITTDSRGISTLEEPTDKIIAKLRYLNGVIMIDYGGSVESYVPAPDINIIFYDANGEMTIGSLSSLPSDVVGDPHTFFMTIDSTYTYLIDNLYIYTGDVSVCSHDEWDEEIITPATCTEKGVKKISCKRCGIFDLLDIAPLGHAWDSGVVTTPATCAFDGVRTFTCTRFADCGAIKTKTIPKNPANHTGGTVERVITPATCTTEGLMGIYCGSCNSLLNTKVIPKLHDLKMMSDAEFLQIRAAGILKNGLTTAQLHLSANNNATLTLVIDCRKFVLAINVNNRNVSGQIELPDGSGTLRFDIKGNGSNIKTFVVTKKLTCTQR